MRKAKKKIVVKEKPTGTDVAVIAKKIFPLVEKANSLKISSDKTMAESVTLLSQMNKIIDGIKVEKKTIIDPAKEIIDRENARWRPIEDQYKPAIAAIRQAQSDYQTQKTREAQEAAAKIAARVGDGKGKLKAETAVAMIDEIDRPENNISTDAGSVRFRTDKKLKIMDETMIPRKYLLPDEKKILEDLKKGIDVKGCIIEEIQTPVNSR